MAKEPTLQDLLALQRARRADRRQATTRYRRRREATPESLATALTSFFGDAPETRMKLEENRALLAWAGYVGEAAARVSEAVRVRNGTLVVRVRDPLWMQQLSLLKHELLRRYREDFPQTKIQDLFLTR